MLFLPHPQIDPLLVEGFPALTIVPPFLHIAKFSVCDCVLLHELQLLIENSVQDFNLVGVVLSHVTLIY